MKKFLSFAFGKMPIAPRSNPAALVHHDDAERRWAEDFMNASSDIDAVWYYERRRWRA